MSIVVNKLKIGDNTPTNFYLGDKEVNKAYLGDQLVWEKGVET